MQFTKIHINALAACGMLAILAGMLLWRGEYCGAVGLAAAIAAVATAFAEQKENGDRDE